MFQVTTTDKEQVALTFKVKAPLEREAKLWGERQANHLGVYAFSIEAFEIMETENADS